jgi:tRNA pseudouridine(55) synthase
MASGKLLVLIGEECKKQSEYHNLDKEYEFSVLIGVASDTHDVLGRLSTQNSQPEEITSELLHALTESLTGNITFTYPLFSAKTVKGKPLHMWTLEGRLDEIEIPTRTSTIYELEFTHLETKPRQEIAALALQKINTIPKVTDSRKALGNNFRRDDIRADWQEFATNFSLPPEYTIAHFRCVCSSGAYMRTLATIIAEKLQTTGIAWHIHRTKIGTFDGADWKQLF